MYLRISTRGSFKRMLFFRYLRLISILCLCLAFCSTSTLAAVLEPSADGTISDGRNAAYDGTPDAWDWIFNDTGYEGSITLNKSELNNWEDRVVWEYDLRGISLQPPLSATLTFTIRGPAVFPRPLTSVHVYAYTANLIEELEDYFVSPLRLAASVPVGAFQPPTAYTIDVSREVNEVLSSGAIAIGFRFQIDPDTLHAINQVFIDALDSDPTTKPALSIEANLRGDSDLDKDVDLFDFNDFLACMQGPEESLYVACDTFDFDLDGDVDLADRASFQVYATLYQASN